MAGVKSVHLRGITVIQAVCESFLVESTVASVALLHCR